MMRLKELRKASGESQASIAKTLNITQQAYANYESGKRTPDVKTLAVLARHYGVSVEYILGEEVQDTENTPAPESQDGSDDREIREYLQMIKDDPKYRIMFDLAKGATLEEIKATVAFLKALREQE